MKQASKKLNTATRSQPGRRRRFYRPATVAAWIDQGVCDIYRKTARNWACSGLMRAALAEELKEAETQGHGAGFRASKRRALQRHLPRANRTQVRLQVESALAAHLKGFVGAHHGALADFVQAALENFIVRRLKRWLAQAA